MNASPVSDAPLRILMVIPGPAEGPSMIFSKRQAAALVRRGVSLRTFFLASRTRPHTVLREFRRLRKEVMSFSPDVVHAEFGTVTALLTVLATRRPVVITFRGGDLNPGATRPWIRSFLGRLMSQLAAWRAAVVICVSDELQRRLWLRAHRAVVIPTGVDTTVFRPGERSDARRALGWSEEPAVLFNAGWDPRRKRLDLAERVLAVVRREMPAVRFEVIGGCVPPDSMPLYLNAADCLLVTSDSEGSPTVVQEAMACGLPIVSVPVGDVPDRLANVEPSAIVSRDVGRLAAAVVEVLQRRERSNGPERVARFSTDALAGLLIDVYRALTPRTRGTP